MSELQSPLQTLNNGTPQQSPSSVHEETSSSISPTEETKASKEEESKQSIRVTRSDPLASTSRRSHLIRGSGSNGSSSNRKKKLSANSNHNQDSRRASTSSRDRRTRWLRDKLQNHYRNSNGGDNYSSATKIYGDEIGRQLSKYRKQYPEYRSWMDNRRNDDSGYQDSGSYYSFPNPTNKLPYDWDSNSVTSANWMSGNDSKSSQFHRPVSVREQHRFLEEAAAERRRRLRAGLSLPEHQQGRISYFDEVAEEGSARKYLESQSGDPEDQDEEEDDEFREELEGPGGKTEFHLTRQRNRPYPYRLKRHYSRFEDGERGIVRRRGGGGGDVEGKGEGRRSRSQSPCSITSESESQENCENALDPPRLSQNSGETLGPNGANNHTAGNGRKFSVLFSFNEAWNEDNIVQSFKEMNPTSTAVFEAAWAGNVKQLEEILTEDENLRKLKAGLFRDNEGRTPLHLASACGHVPCVELLLSKGADVNAADGNEHRATPLSCAASCGSVDVMKVLLKNGANVNSGYEQGKTALHWAVQAGSVDCAKILLEAGAKQNPPQVYSETPIHIAAALGDPDCLQLLLDYGADVNLCKGTNRSTALHLSAEEGSAACVRLLLKAGASHVAKDIRGHTALHVAATCDADSVIALLKAGADPNSEDANGRTPLHCAVARGSRAAECVRLLVESGADIDAQDNYGYTPLHLSAVNESSQCASILLHHGSDVTLKTNAGTNALSLLVRKIPDVMRYLVDRLDSAVTIHDHDPVDPDCEIRLDFRAIVPNCEKRDKQNGYKNGPIQNGHAPQTQMQARLSMADVDSGMGKKGGKKKDASFKPHKETEFLTCLLAAGNKKILAHPLSEAFLTLKWRTVRKFFWASLLFQIALVALFTIYVVEVYLIMCPYRRGHDDHVDPTEESRGQLFVMIPPPPTRPPPSPPDPYKLLRNNSKSNLIVPPPPVPPLTLLNANETGHNISRRSADPNNGFQWFSVKPAKPNKTRPSKYRIPDSSMRSALPTTPRSKGRGVNIILGAPAMAPSPTWNLTTPPPRDDAELRKEPIQCTLTTELQVIWILLVVFASLMAIKEVFQLLQSPLSYVTSSENWGQWLLISSVTVAAWSTPDFQLEYWQYPAAASGIFLAWGLMLLQVGRFPALGLYVQMLGKVAANFGLFILAYACLLIAFALAFCVMFPEHPPYSSIFLSILKVFTMMVGEVDYEDLFYNEDRSHDPTLFPLTAHLLYGAFVVIVTIVLMNLLVGLAVHDIQGLQKGAKLNRLSRQTALISRLESFIFSKKLQMLLPRKVGSILQKSALLVPSSYNWSFYFRPNDPRDKRLPKDIKLASLRLAASRHSSGKSKSHHSSHSHRYPQNIHCSPDARPGASPSRPISKVSHHTRASSAMQLQISPESAIRRVEQRLDHLQMQLDKILTCLNVRVDAVFEAILTDDRPEFRRLSSMLERSQSQSDNDNVFMEGFVAKSPSASPSITSGALRPLFSTEPSILKDVSCEKG